MTLKNAILISAATYFVLNFILWAMGWLVWPVLWIASGYASIKVWEWSNRERYNFFYGLDVGEKIICLTMGPILGIVAFFLDGVHTVSWPKWFPKIRNPFIWPEKELDKQESEE